MCKFAFLNVLRTKTEMWMNLVQGAPETHELGETSPNDLKQLPALVLLDWELFYSFKANWYR